MDLDQLTQKNYDALVKDRTQCRDVLATAAALNDANKNKSLLDDYAVEANYEMVGRIVIILFQNVLYAHARELAEA